MTKTNGHCQIGSNSYHFTYFIYVTLHLMLRVKAKSSKAATVLNEAILDIRSSKQLDKWTNKLDN